MRAQTVLHVAAWLLGGAAVLLLTSYWTFLPVLERAGGERFKRESAKLVEAEKARWAAYKRTGQWPAEAERAPVRRGLGQVLTRLRRRGRVEAVAAGEGD